MKENEVITERIQSAFRSLATAIEELGDITANTINNRRRLYDMKAASALKGVSYKTIASVRHMQPMAGFSNHTEGSKRMWTEEQIEEWLEITSETRALYLEALLTCPDVGDGVLAELMAQHSAGTLPDYLVSVIEGHICRH
ncbi:hypothetical protein [Sediminispirochaeta smaragdinae]|uniref:Uncharacterized protein n=1 Tax=Sediminispirochaeta smaragdinae (strain DSM 11293 / JCM 15392 / SEBR 4228) TaxID=573413 RepID=E1R3K7_SEDSS|nr:hypothetical protein [Sediminispirochaeta smaragdinae]ADK81638.1 hypothetical protein Spirs_2525 [Sediminispirochaeta smaragdinae DSM 11293]